MPIWYLWVMEKLRTWRIGANISAQEAGDRVGVSAVQWTRYETGKRSVSIDRLGMVSAMTGIPASEIRPDLYKAFDATKDGIDTMGAH